MPIRLRLTLAFALAMAAVLAATGLFLYARLGAALLTSLDDGLRSRAAAVAALVQQADHGLAEARGRFGGSDRSFAQVLDTRGRVFDATGGLGGRPLLAGATLAAARTRASVFSSTLGDGAVRLYALPVHAQDRDLLVVVGASLEPRANALAGLRTELFAGGPIALLVSALLGYVLAAAALRPVERMRRRAAEISAAEPGQRLPLPSGRDEVRRLGETLNEMLARLEAGIERERSFVSDASHELRTPLALLKAEVELALDDPHASAPDLRAALSSARDETDRLAQLAEDLLLLARVDEGVLPIRRAPVDVAAVLEDVALRFEGRAGAAGRRIEVDGRAAGTVTADRIRLEQALGNLVENALRYGAGTVGLDALVRDGAVELHVTDEGGGFAPAFLEHAFERFSRGDEGRGRGGTGLGLAIVETIARAHGGTAGAANRPGGGADVWFSLAVLSRVASG